METDTASSQIFIIKTERRIDYQIELTCVVTGNLDSARALKVRRKQELDSGRFRDRFPDPDFEELDDGGVGVAETEMSVHRN